MLDRLLGLGAALGVALLLSGAACGPGYEDAPMVELSEAPRDGFEGPLPEGTWLALVPEQSKVGFMGAKVTATRDGRFVDVSGTAVVVGEEPVAVELEVRTGSLETELPKLTAHLRDPDFLDAEHHPVARFRSSTIEARSGANGATHVVTGVLEIRGVRKQLSFPAKIVVTGESATGQARFRFDRQAYGIAYSGGKDDLIRDDALLDLDLRFNEG